MTVSLSVTPVYGISKSVAIVIVLAGLFCGNFSVWCNTVIMVKFPYLSFDIRSIASLLLLRELFHRTYLGSLPSRDVCVMHFTILSCQRLFVHSFKYLN